MAMEGHFFFEVFLTLFAIRIWPNSKMCIFMIYKYNNMEIFVGNTDTPNAKLVAMPSDVFTHTVLPTLDISTRATLAAQIEIGDVVNTHQLGAAKNSCFLVYQWHESFNNSQTKRFFGRIGKQFLKHIEVEVVLPSNLTGERLEMAIVGLLQGSYSFDTYRTKKRSALKKINIRSVGLDNHEQIRRACILGEAISVCRDMVNAPANHMGPEEFSNYADTVALAYGLKVQHYNVDDCESMGMGGIVNVGRSSHRQPRLLVITWPGDTINRDCKPIALCGKGVCFDTGGLNLKNADGMALMRKDMGGAACVLSAMIAIARLKLPHPVTAFIPLADNAVSSTSLRPGDVISMHNGVTVEISNTDNEGRLLLADAISFAASAQPKAILSVATLTGEALLALGRVYVPVMSNDDSWCDSLMRASELAGEKLWRLPFDDDYLGDIQGNSADLSNVCRGEAGCIAAGLFLSQFSGKLPFVHCDISPSSWMTREHDLGPEGATGVLVGSLVKLSEIFHQMGVTS